MQALRARNQINLGAGLLYVLIGAGFALGTLGLRMGSAARMGPGFFPLVVSLLLVAIGLSIAAGALRPAATRTRIERWDLRRNLIILGSVVAFGLLVTSAGLVVAIVVLVTMSSLASDEFDIRVALLNALVLAVAGSAIFVYGLGLLFPLWPPVLGG